MRSVLALLGLAALAIVLALPLGAMTIGSALWVGGLAAGLAAAVAGAVRQARRPDERRREKAERPDWLG